MVSVALVRFSFSLSHTPLAGEGGTAVILALQIRKQSHVEGWAGFQFFDLSPSGVCHQPNCYSVTLLQGVSFHL